MLFDRTDCQKCAIHARMFDPIPQRVSETSTFLQGDVLFREMDRASNAPVVAWAVSLRAEAFFFEPGLRPKNSALGVVKRTT
jgi:hypothetical protein